MLKKYQQGFTLLEVIVSIFIITTGMLAILSLDNFSLKAISVNKSQIIASGLAQEGIEIVRNWRESECNATDCSNWYGAVIDNDYIVQYDFAGVYPYVEKPLLYDNSSNHGYQYDYGDATQFYRKITLKKAPAFSYSQDEVQVIVDVIWNGGELKAEDRLWKSR